jgi:cell division protein FtsB
VNLHVSSLRARVRDRFRRPPRPADSGGEPRSRRKTAFTGRAAILAVVLAALVIALAGPLRQLLSQRAQLDSLRGQVSSEQAELNSLQQQQKLWSDPNYVRNQARERLHYVMPGEIPYVTLGPTPSASASAGPAHDNGNGPWYAQLWSSVQQAAATATPTPDAAATPTPDAAATPTPTPSSPAAATP